MDLGSGSGGGEEQTDRPMISGSGGAGVDQEESGDHKPTSTSHVAEASGDERTTSRVPTGPGVDQEESGQQASAHRASGDESGSGSGSYGSGGQAGGESEDGEFSTWKEGTHVAERKNIESMRKLPQASRFQKHGRNLIKVIFVDQA